MEINNLKIGDSINVKTYSAQKYIINKRVSRAKIIKFYPRYMLLDFGKYKTCVMNEDIVNRNWVAIWWEAYIVFGKYIMFKKNQIGDDGYLYIRGVKYKIKKDDIDSFYVTGTKGHSNRFIKAQINAKCEIGNINKDYWGDEESITHDPKGIAVFLP